MGGLWRHGGRRRLFDRQRILILDLVLAFVTQFEHGQGLDATTGRRERLLPVRNRARFAHAHGTLPRRLFLRLQTLLRIPRQLRTRRSPSLELAFHIVFKTARHALWWLCRVQLRERILDIVHGRVHHAAVLRTKSRRALRGSSSGRRGLGRTLFRLEATVQHHEGG